MAIYRGTGLQGEGGISDFSQLVQDAQDAAAAAEQAYENTLEIFGDAEDVAAAVVAAQLAETNAETAEANAELAETNAETAATNAANSASAASTSATNAASSATSASNSASTATTQATNAANSATAAATSASNASTSATNAANSATTATNQATNAATSATSAANSATTATNSANTAISKANEASASASAASASASSASSSAVLAATSAAEAINHINEALDLYNGAAALEDAVDAAQASATNAANSATASSASSTASQNSATSAATSATNAANSATQAAASASSAAAIVTGVASNRPSIRPSLLLDFANTKQLDPRITFSRASTATYYDGKTVAKAEENLLLQSQSLGTSPWGSGNATVTNNTGDTNAPDGTSTATKITLNATSGVAKWVRQDQTSLSNVVVSFYAKKGTHSIIQIYAEGNSANYCNFDLNAGTVGTAGANASGSIIALDNGWYRCIVVFGATAGGRTYISAVDSTSAAFGATTNAVSVDFYAWGAQREQRSTATAYTPTTTAPITNYIPALQTAGANVARFDHNPVTGESLGLEIEEQRTNLLTYSEQFDDAAWTKARSSITSNTIVAPDGTLTGDALIEDTTATNTHNVGRSFSFTSGLTYTISVFAKATRSPRFLQIIFPSGAFGNTRRPVFDLVNGTALAAPDTTASIQNVGNGWYRCIASMLATSTNSASLQFQLADTYTAGLPSYTGDGFSGIYIWGAQVEAGSFPTSYIKTVASQVTRSADSASMTGSNFSSWYRADEGTLYGEFQWATNFARQNSSLFRFDDGTVNNNIILGFRNVANANGTISCRVSGGTAYETTTGTVITTNTLPHKFAGCYTANELGFSADGVAAGTTTNVGVPVVNTARIGSSTSGVLNNYAIYIKRIAYYPKRLSNTELQGLTS